MQLEIETRHTTLFQRLSNVRERLMIPQLWQNFAKGFEQIK